MRFECRHDTGGEFTTVYHGRLLGLAALFHEPSEFWIGSRKDHYTTNSCVASGAVAGGPSVALAASRPYTKCLMSEEKDG